MASSNPIIPIEIEGVNGLWYRALWDTDKAGKLLILLHGYGADMHDLIGLSTWFKPQVDLLCLDGLMATPFGGREWFDITYTPTGDLVFNDAQALTAARKVANVIRKFLKEMALSLDIRHHTEWVNC